MFARERTSARDSIMQGISFFDGVPSRRDNPIFGLIRSEKERAREFATASMSPVIYIEE